MFLYLLWGIFDSSVVITLKLSVKLHCISSQPYVTDCSRVSCAKKTCRIHGEFMKSGIRSLKLKWATPSLGSDKFDRVFKANLYPFEITRLYAAGARMWCMCCEWLSLQSSPNSKAKIMFSYSVLNPHHPIFIRGQQQAGASLPRSDAAVPSERIR